MGIGSGQSARAMFEILVHEHADMLECYLRSLMGAGASVDDLFQETMMVAWRRIGDYDRSRSFAAWVRGIAQVLVVKHASKSASRPMTVDPGVLAEIDRRFERLGRLPGDRFLDRVESLARCIEALPGALREALDLVYARGMTIVGAAQALGANEETLKKRVQRGRRMVADCMGVGEAGA